MDVVAGETTGAEDSAGLWGKWPLAPAAPYPLIGHLLDAAAIAARIWERWVSEPLKRRLSEALPGSDGELLYLWLAGSHDLGKADPIFQGQLLARGPSDPKFGAHLGLTGLPKPDRGWVCNVSAYMDSLRPHLRHEALTADILRRAGAHDAVCAVVGGHHGRYPCSPQTGLPVRVAEHREFLSGGPWHERHLGLMRSVASAIGLTQIPRAEVLTGELIPLLTGLVVLADWLASDESFIASSPSALLGEPRQYYLARREQVDNHLQARLGYPIAVAGSFEGLFGFPPDRPVQQWAVTQTEPSGLTVIAVPMGEGKTETVFVKAVEANGS